ncbi:hypothetical protein [Novipirellula rosea]|uniref:Uncharacterized protein n=1 Tax=Novipirellula rosea TaxID=1031540 RepID=A0ABP8MTI3_9BACT
MLEPHIDELRLNATRCYNNDVIRPKLMESARKSLRYPDALQDDDKLPDEKLDLLIWKLCQDAMGVEEIESPVTSTSDSELRVNFAIWDQSFEQTTSEKGVLPLTKQMKLRLRVRLKRYLGNLYETIGSTVACERFWVRHRDIQRVYDVSRQQVGNWRKAEWWPAPSPFGEKTWYSDEVTKAINDQPKIGLNPRKDWRDVCHPSQLVGWLENAAEIENDKS